MIMRFSLSTILSPSKEQLTILILTHIIAMLMGYYYVYILLKMTFDLTSILTITMSMFFMLGYDSKFMFETIYYGRGK